MPTPVELTARQQAVKEAIERYWQDHHHGPSMRGLADAVGVNLSTLQKHLDHLKAAGVVTWEPGLPRTVRVL